MEKRILFLAHDAGLYGANQSLMNMISALKAKNIFASVIFPFPGGVCDVFKEKGWDYHIIPFRSELRPKSDGQVDRFLNLLRAFYQKIINFKALRKLEYVVKVNNINVIHSNSAVIEIGVHLARKHSIAHIWHLREFIHPNYGLHVFGGLEDYKKKIQNTENILCVSYSIAKGFGVQNKSLVLYDAVRKQPSHINFGTKDKYFLFCGALIKNKGIEEAIDAFNVFFSSNKEYRLLIVGEGSKQYEVFLYTKIKNLGLESHIEFLGFRNDMDILFSKATAFLMCSRNEAMGRVTVEAMLNSCIVFGYDDSGTGELIEDQKTGFLYKDIDQLVMYMEAIVTDKKRFDVVRSLAYQYASENFLEAKFVDKLVEYYDRLKMPQK